MRAIIRPPGPCRHRPADRSSPRAGVVHQQRDRRRRATVARPATYRRARTGRRAGSPPLTPWAWAKSIRQGFQALPVARHQQQVVATAGQVLGVGRADSGRGAGDQGDAIANLFVHVGSRWKSLTADSGCLYYTLNIMAIIKTVKPSYPFQRAGRDEENLHATVTENANKRSGPTPPRHALPWRCLSREDHASCITVKDSMLDPPDRCGRRLYRRRLADGPGEPQRQSVEDRRVGVYGVTLTLLYSISTAYHSAGERSGDAQARPPVHLPADRRQLHAFLPGHAARSSPGRTLFGIVWGAWRYSACSRRSSHAPGASAVGGDLR